MDGFYEMIDRLQEDLAQYIEMQGTLGTARDHIECTLMEAAESGEIIDYRSSYRTDGAGLLYAQIGVSPLVAPIMIEINLTGLPGE